MHNKHFIPDACGELTLRILNTSAFRLKTEFYIHSLFGNKYRRSTTLFFHSVYRFLFYKPASLDLNHTRFIINFIKVFTLVNICKLNNFKSF